MLRKTRIAALVSTLLPTYVLAQTIEGVIINSNGNAVSNALVRVEGTAMVSSTDENGKFILEGLSSGTTELHITADGFAHLHQHVELDADQTQQITFTLERSPIEVIDVVATPVHMSIMESSAPVSVLSGDTLRRQQSATLGDSLEKVVGVHSNFHGKVASTPIIRGLSGPRVLIAQNGLDVGDVSRVGPDHSVASEASTAQQLEVLRGPATLFYGSGAVGGVVNVVDNRVPTDKTTRGEWLLEGDSVSDQSLASFNVTTGQGAFAFYADGFWRDADDYEVPVAPELEADHEEHDEHENEHGDERKVANSAEESNGFTLGASYLFDTGYVGVAVEQFNREYGIPGHGHGGESHEEHGDESHEEHGDEESVFADLEQTRIQLQGEYNPINSWLNQINIRAAYTDYEHAEVEEGVVGTVFENESHEVKIDLLHDTFAHWKGGWSLHYKNSEVTAQGEEAFTPPSEQETIALAIMEERHFGDVLVQLGARVEHVTIDAPRVLLPEIELHGHDEHDEGEVDGHQGEEMHDGDEHADNFPIDLDFTPVTISAGLVWDFTPGYNIGLSVSRSERAPSAAELLSFGPHIATGTYEVGALFTLHDEEDHQAFELSEETLEVETANNIDLTFRKMQGDLGFVFNLFYNRIDNYYYQADTGLFTEGGHGHEEDEAGHMTEPDLGHDDHDEEGHDEHSEDLPIYLFQTDDVILSGFEAQIAWQATDDLKATFFSDYVRARLQNGGDLPRTPPLRFGTQLSYHHEGWQAHLDITRYQEQDRIAAEETVTDGYTLVDASVSYTLPLAQQDLEIYLKGSNLTDTEARVHSSFLKNQAPRPGRGFALGVRGVF